MGDAFEYTCSCCGERHAGLPDVVFDSPLHYHALTPDERAAAFLNSDMCRIEDERFIRGVLEIPIVGTRTTFAYGVWVSLSPSNFQRYVELCEGRQELPDHPWFGWLCNRVPGYPDTLHLKTHVHLRAQPARPFVELEPTNHPLALEQRAGISVERWREICEAHMHAK